MLKRLTALVAALLLASSARAEECHLEQLASLTMETLPSGLIVIPVKVAGTDERFLLDTDEGESGVLSHLADKLQLKAKHLPHRWGIYYWSFKVFDTVLLPDVMLGNSHIADLPVLLLDTKKESIVEGNVTGILGMNVLSHYDVELDFKNNKLNLYSPNQCNGNVVYWSDVAVSLPFITDLKGVQKVAMTLDGQLVVTELSTGATQANMDLSVAHGVFGLNASSDGMQAEDRHSVTWYHYPFKSLSAEGLVISNPNIVIVDFRHPYCKVNNPEASGTLMRCAGETELMLGLEQVRKLHVWYAFKEKKIYVTSADAHK